MVLAINEDALMWMAPFGLFGMLFLLGVVMYAGWAERREDKRRWSGVSSRLAELGLKVVVAPRPPRLGQEDANPDSAEVLRFLKDLRQSCWQPPSRIKAVRWLAQGEADGRHVRLAEIELLRRGQSTVYVENFLLTEAPGHWPDFCLVRKEAARGMAARGRIALKQRVWITLAPVKVLLMTRSERVSEALRSESLDRDCEGFPRDEEWFVTAGVICCHWSQPLNGDRPEQMVRRVEEFVGLMERHMLRMPRGL